jgi:hypothetical protein
MEFGVQPEALNAVHVTVMGVPHKLRQLAQLMWVHGETLVHNGVELTMA